MLEIHRLVEAETVGDCRVGGIPEDDLAATDDERNVARPDAELIEQRLHARLGVEIDRRERMPVACEKLFDAQRARAMHRSGDDDVAVTALDELCATKNERPRDDLADVALRLHEPEELGA